jgi:hypothetical protein
VGAFRVPRAALLVVAVAALPFAFVNENEVHSTSLRDGVGTQKARISIDASQMQALHIPRTHEGQLGSLLNIRTPLQVGSYVWNDEGVAAGSIAVRVDLKLQLISVFRAGHEIGTAVILYGADEKPTPTGLFEVTEKFEDHRSSLYGADMPYTLRLTSDGVAIHGSTVRRGAATHGCVGVPMEFAKLLFREARRGDKVTII